MTNATRRAAALVDDAIADRANHDAEMPFGLALAVRMAVAGDPNARTTAVRADLVRHVARMLVMGWAVGCDSATVAVRLLRQRHAHAQMRRLVDEATAADVQVTEDLRALAEDRIETAPARLRDMHAALILEGMRGAGLKEASLRLAVLGEIAGATRRATLSAQPMPPALHRARMDELAAEASAIALLPAARIGALLATAAASAETISAALPPPGEALVVAVMMHLASRELAADPAFRHAHDRMLGVETEGGTATMPHGRRRAMLEMRTLLEAVRRTDRRTPDPIDDDRG